jgi:hypothetical protein
MSLFYLYRFKFAVKLQIILFENAIKLGISQPGQFQGSFGLVVGKSTRPSRLASSAPPPNHLIPVFSGEKALNIKNINKTRRPRSRLGIYISPSWQENTNLKLYTKT